MTTLSFQLPDSLRRHAERLAAIDGFTLDQFLALAAEKIAALEAGDYLAFDRDRSPAPLTGGTGLPEQHVKPPWPGGLVPMPADIPCARKRARPSNPKSGTSTPCSLSGRLAEPPRPRAQIAPTQTASSPHACGCATAAAVS